MAVVIPTFYAYLRNGEGEKSAIGNYSDGGGDFSFGPSEDFVCVVYRMIVTIEDRGVFDVALYGNQVELANGIEVYIDNAVDSERIDLLDGVPIKSNLGWGSLCYDIIYQDFGSGPNALLARWTFAKAGDGLRLDGRRGERLHVKMRDDFRRLRDHKFMIQGERIQR